MSVIWFWLSGYRNLSDTISGRKLKRELEEGDGGTIWGQPVRFGCMGICVLSSAHECEIEGFPFYLLIIQIFISWIFKKFSHSIHTYSIGRPRRFCLFLSAEEGGRDF